MELKGLETIVSKQLIVRVFQKEYVDDKEI